MKVTFIGHASLLVEANGIRILSDPWWKGPCFGAQWWTYPAPETAAVDAAPIDFVYISHGHHDHFHPSTLRLLRKGTTFLVAHGLDLEDPIRALGFDVVSVGVTETRDLGRGVTCRIMRTHGDDSLMVLSDGRETCLNLNDALHSAPGAVQARFIAVLRDIDPAPDYLFCGYGTASHFPNCYVVPGKDREQTAVRRQQHFNRTWAAIVSALTPRFAFPFAADVVFLEDDLRWLNEPVHNTERPTDVFRREHPHAATRELDIAPGFVIEDGVPIVPRLRRPVDAKTIEREFDDAIRRVNRLAPVDLAELEHVRQLLASRVGTLQPYLATFPSDYRCVLRIRHSDLGIEIRKSGADLTVETVTVRDGHHADLVYTTRLAYLLRSLTTPYGHEVFFVGSGGIFEYRDVRVMKLNLHQEIVLVLRSGEVPTRRRPGRLRSWAARAKALVRSALGRRETDLYDLGRWTVFR